MRRGTDFTKYLVEVLSVLVRRFGTASARTRPNKRCSRQNIVRIHGLDHQGKNSQDIIRMIPKIALMSLCFIRESNNKVVNVVCLIRH